jgi:hypothetical protein
VSRPNPVVSLDRRTPDELADVVERALGRVSALVSIPLLSVPAGHNVPAGGTVTIESTHRVINSADAQLNQCRLNVRGSTAAAGPITCQLYDLTSAVVLATVQITTVLGTRFGTWVTLSSLWNADHEVVLRVVGDTANAQTIYMAEAQFRTLSLVQ